MNQGNPKNWKKSVQHPSEDDLLCYIDGELSPKLNESLRSHLEACWHCRNRAEKFQTAISLFIDYRSQVVQPLSQSPNDWRGFGSKLKDAVAITMPPSLLQRWLGALSRLRVSLQNIEPRVARLTAISVFTIILGFAGVYFLFISSQTIVSAEELINRAAASREAELKDTDKPVLYQQLRVKRRNAQGEGSTSVELWQDIDNLRMRQVTVPTGGSQDAPKTTVLTDLDQILRANNYEPPPLSIIGYRAWRNTLADKRDSVEEARTDDGISVLRLQTELTTPPTEGRIISSTLIVRANDFHPLEQSFRVLTSDGEQEFELRETSFAVMSLNSLNPGFFADAVPVLTSARPLPSPGVSPEDITNSNVIVTNTNTERVAVTTNAIANPELEVEVLDLLHNAGADLGEQIEVHRTPNGPMTITGVVETPERKNQILTALQSVTGNPAVKIQINTVADAIAQQKQAKAQPKPSVENVEVEGNTFPAEADLRSHFGEGSDQAVKQFAARMTSRSSQAMNYLWAMKRLKGQFSPGEIQKLTPEARAKWLGVICSHARSYQNEIAALKRELQPIFGGATGGGDGESISSDAELIQAVDRLFESGSGANQIVRQAFTTSSSHASTNALRTAQFWRMLNNAEALAQSIAEARTK